MNISQNAEPVVKQVLQKRIKDLERQMQELASFGGFEDEVEAFEKEREILQETLEG